jgi:hypothetical protein
MALALEAQEQASKEASKEARARASKQPARSQLQQPRPKRHKNQPQVLYSSSLLGPCGSYAAAEEEVVVLGEVPANPVAGGQYAQHMQYGQHGHPAMGKTGLAAWAQMYQRAAAC